jgi:hypothetical protein
MRTLKQEFDALVKTMQNYDIYQSDDEVGEALNNLEAKILEVEKRINCLDIVRNDIYQTISKYTRSIDGDVEHIDLTRGDHDNIQSCTHDIGILIDLEDSMPIEDNWHDIFVEKSHGGIPYRNCCDCGIKEEETVMTKCTNEVHSIVKYMCNDCKDISEGKTNVDKKDEIEKILISKWAILGMDVPSNFEDIVQFVYEDVCETADPLNWNDSDVVIGFRRWIESN